MDTVIRRYIARNKLRERRGYHRRTGSLATLYYTDRQSKLQGPYMYWSEYRVRNRVIMCDGGVIHGRCFVKGHTRWYGTTGETAGTEIGKEAHDAEMAAFRPKLDMVLVIPWLIVAKRLKIYPDVARLIAELLLDESNFGNVYWSWWCRGFPVHVF